MPLEPQELIQMVEKLYTWLGRNNIPTKGVKVYIEFPTESVKNKAVRSFKEEFHPSAFDFDWHKMIPMETRYDTLGTIFGIQVTFGSPTKTDLEEFLRALDNK